MENVLIKKSSDSLVWGRGTKLLHWLSAVYVIGLICVGFYMAKWATPPLKFQLIQMHKAFGALFLVLVLIRLIWRWTHMISPISQNPLHWLSVLSAPVLYLCMLIMPISGILMSQTAGYPISIFGLFEVPTIVEKSPEWASVFVQIHVYSAYMLTGLIALHTIAALFHHFVLKDDVLRRMWFSKKYL